MRVFPDLKMKIELSLILDVKQKNKYHEKHVSAMILQ